MSGTRSSVTLEIEPELEEQARALFRSLGMDLGTATEIFYRQALRCHGLPFKVEPDEPNSTTYAAVEEAEKMLKDPDAKQFSRVADLFAELDS